MLLCFQIIIWDLPFSLIAQDSICRSLSMKETVDIALNNNLLLKSAKLSIDLSGEQRSGAFCLHPTEFTFKFGQMYSEHNDKYLEVNQNFGSIFTHIRILAEANYSCSLQIAQYDLVTREIIAEVKSAYSCWEFLFNKVQLLEKEKDIYERLLKITELRFNSGDIDNGKRSLMILKSNDITSQYLEAAGELKIATDKLIQYIQIDGDFKPVTTEPELFEINRKPDTSGYQGRSYLEYYTSKANLSISDAALAKSCYFPEFKAGFFTQELNNQNGFYGWQIGLAIPLWVPNLKSGLTQSKIRAEIALNELENEKILIHSEVETLLDKLDMYFKQIIFFQEKSLPQAELLLSAAQSQLDNEEINFADYVESISLAMKIKQNYLEAIQNYNQTAIQLEIYAN